MASRWRSIFPKLSFALAVLCPIDVAILPYLMDTRSGTSYTFYTPYMSIYSNEGVSESSSFRFGFASLVALTSVLFLWGWFKRRRSMSLMLTGLFLPVLVEVFIIFPSLWQGASAPRRYQYYYSAAALQPSFWSVQFAPASSLDYFVHALSLTLLVVGVLATITAKSNSTLDG